MAHRTPKSTAVSLDEGIPGKITTTSLTLPERMTYPRWEQCGALLGQTARSVQWWCGDWLAFGEDRFGEKFAQALEGTGHDPKTLLEWVRVCRAVTPTRRLEALSFAHHSIVSTLEADDQRYWLQKAAKGDKLPSGEWEKWSARRLRAELKKEETPAIEAGVEVEVIARDEVPEEFWVLDLKAVREAYAAGRKEIPGLKIKPPEGS